MNEYDALSDWIDALSPEARAAYEAEIEKIHATAKESSDWAARWQKYEGQPIYREIVENIRRVTRAADGEETLGSVERAVHARDILKNQLSEASKLLKVPLDEVGLGVLKCVDRIQELEVVLSFYANATIWKPGGIAETDAGSMARLALNNADDCE